MRRAGRKRLNRRDRDASPLMLVTDDRYPGESIEALVRWLFRYRSELAPITAAVAAAIAGAVLHASHPGWWPGVVVATIAAAAALARASRWLDRAEERLYAAGVAVMAGGWIAAAAASGPGAGPLPAVLVIGTVGAGLPWWRHRRRRARVRVERTLAAWPHTADAIGLKDSRVLSALVDRWGWRARIRLHRGQTVTDALNRLPAIESGLGTRPGAVRVEPDPDRADRFTLRVLANDPHAKPIPWPGTSTASIADPAELGVFEDATPVRVSFLRRHALLGGIAGSGKSGILNVLLANLAACPDVVLWGIDLKGGMELRPWQSCLDRLATTPREATRLLRDAARVLEARATAFGEQGGRLWTPTADAPALVIVIDEYAELTDESPEAVAHADSIARRGRAVAVTLLAATQRPTQHAMGKGAVRSQMDIRLCLRVRERRDVDLVLGQGMSVAGWPAHTLDAPGKFLASTPELSTPRRARAYLLGDDAVRITAARYASRRPALDAMSADALNPNHDPTQETTTDETPDPDSALWTVLREAPAEGLSVAELMQATGMGRTWVYDRLQQHADARRVTQVGRGRWRATTPDT